jgi:hypothetical protein
MNASSSLTLTHEGRGMEEGISQTVRGSGSFVGGSMKLTITRMRIAIAIGDGGDIGAIFRLLLGEAMFSSKVMRVLFGKSVNIFRARSSTRIMLMRLSAQLERACSGMTRQSD